MVDWSQFKPVETAPRKKVDWSKFKPAEQEESGFGIGSAAKYAGQKFAQGALYTANMIPAAIQIATSAADEDSVVGELNRDARKISDSLTGVSENIQESVDPYYAKKESQPIFYRDDKGDVKFSIPNKEQFIGLVAGSLAPGGAIGKVGKGLTAGSKALGLGRKSAAMLGFGAANTTVIAPNVYDETRRAAKELGLDDDKADEAGMNAVKLFAPVAAVTGAVGAGGAALSRGGMLTRAAKGGLKEIVPEGVEESAEYASQSTALGQGVDPLQAASVATLGGVGGFGQGAVIGAMNGEPRRTASIDEVIPKEGPAGKPAKTPAGLSPSSSPEQVGLQSEMLPDQDAEVEVGMPRMVEPSSKQVDWSQFRPANDDDVQQSIAPEIAQPVAPDVQRPIAPEVIDAVRPESKIVRAMRNLDSVLPVDAKPVENVRPNMASDVQPQVAPDIRPEAAQGIGPEVAPDIPPEIAPETGVGPVQQPVSAPTEKALLAPRLSIQEVRNSKGNPSKSFVVVGDTKAHRDRIRKATGKEPLYNRKLKGYVFPKSRIIEVENSLQDLLVTPEVKAPALQQPVPPEIVEPAGIESPEIAPQPAPPLASAVGVETPIDMQDVTGQDQNNGQAQSNIDRPGEAPATIPQAVGAGDNQGEPGAVERTEVSQPVQKVIPQGAPRRVYTAQGKPVDVQYAVVEADELVASNSPDGAVNANYPQDLQPRDRTRVTSASQISKIASNLEPERLGESPSAGEGAPIVGPDGVVESGNGRVSAIRSAYRGVKGSEYRDWIKKNSQTFGVDKQGVNTMREPVLVRVRTTPMDNVGRSEFTRQANQSSVASMSPAEQAKTDGDRLTPEDFAAYAPSEDGNVLASSNAEFLKRFTQKIGENEAAGLSTSDGRFTKQMADRVQAAVFQKAYGDERLLTLFAEEADPDIKNILNALNRAAPSFARTSGDNINIVPDIVGAVEVLRQSKAKGIALDEIVGQQDAFADPVSTETETIARFMDGNKRSARRMGDAFAEMARLVEAENNPSGNLFDEAPASIGDIIKSATKSAPKSGALFSRGGNKPQVESWLKSTRSRLSAYTDTEIVQSVADLPFEAPADARGAYYEGKTYVVADNIRNAREARTVLTHEVVGHQGLERMLGTDGMSDLVNKIKNEKKIGNRRIAEAASQVAKDTSTRGNPDREAKEILAYLAEKGIKSSVLRDVVAKVRVWLAKQGLGNLPDAEIEQLIARSARFVEGKERATRRDPVISDDTVAQAPLFSTGNTTLDSFVSKAGLNRARVSMPDRARNYISQGWDVIREDIKYYKEVAKQGGADKFHGIKRAEGMLGHALPAEQSGYVAARLSTGMPSIMDVMLRKGAPQWRGGIISMKDGSQGLLEILAPVKADLDHFLGWMVARRAKRLMSEGRENNFTKEEIKEGLALADGREAEFEAVAKQFDAFKKQVLDVAEQAGMIDSVTRPAWDQADYIPFYRMQEANKRIGPTNKKGFSHQKSGIEQLKGGSQAINDPLENIIMNFTHLLDASMKNNALRQTIKNLHGTEIIEAAPKKASELISTKQINEILDTEGIKVPTPEIVAGIRKMLASRIPLEDGIVRVMDGGKAKHYKVNDPMLLQSLTAIEQTPLGGLAIPSRWFKRALTQMVTAEPTFMLRNFIRDAMSAWVISEDHFKFGIDSVRGLVKTAKEEGGTLDMMFSGGSFLGGYVNSNDPTATAKSIRSALRTKGFTDNEAKSFMATILDKPLKLWDAWGTVGSFIENANREAVYEAAIREGKSRAQAVFEAKDLMDYSMQGNWIVMRAMGDILPFFNARVQGLYKLGRAGASNPKQILKRAMGSITMLSMTLMALNWDDDRYDELPDWDKDTYWHIFAGEMHFRIPKPFEVGTIFGSMPERLTRGLLGKDTPEKTFQRFMWMITSTFAVDPTPQIVKPLYELATNKVKFTGMPIEDMGDEFRLPSARYDEYTSETMRAIGSVSSDITGVSPKQLEHLWRGYWGTLGMYGLGLSDMAVRALQGKPSKPSLRIDEIPIIGAFVRDDPAKSTVYRTDFYDLYFEISRIYATVNGYENDGEIGKSIAEAKKYPDELRVKETLDSAYSQMSDIGNLMDATLKSSKSPDAKRRALDNFYLQQNKIAKQAMMEARAVLE